MLACVVIRQKINWLPIMATSGYVICGVLHIAGIQRLVTASHGMIECVQRAGSCVLIMVHMNTDLYDTIRNSFFRLFPYAFPPTYVPT